MRRKFIFIPPALMVLLLVSICYAQSIRRTFDFPSSASSIQPGDITDDSILVADIANGDWGDFTISTNVASLDPNVVAASELAAGDYGDVSISTAGVITIDSGVVSLADFAAGVAAGDILYWSGAAWTILDCNAPNNVLVISDSNLPVWATSPTLGDVTLPDGGEVGPGAGSGGGNGKIKFNSSSSQIYVLNGDVGIGTETITAGTQLTVSEPTNAAPLYVEWRADSDGDDNSDIWRWLIADGGGYVTLQSYSTGSWVDVDWLGLVGTDPDLDTRGQISVDTDGANEPNDVVLRTTDIGADTQYALAQALKTITVPINNPDSITAWTGRADTAQPIWFNGTGMTFTITEIYAVCDTDDYSFSLFESASATDMSDENDTLIDAILCETDGTEGYTDTETTISHATIEHDHAIIFSHTAVDAGGLIVQIRGYFNSDVD